jgi:signal transduction histidine kinase
MNTEDVQKGLLAMLKSAWLSPPRHLLVFLFFLTLVPAVGLVWLGLVLLQQDQALEVQRRMDRQELAADRIIDLLQQEITATRQTLADPARAPEPPASDSVVVFLHSGEAEIHPSNRLLYQPTIPAEMEPPIQPYLTGERYEFQQNDNARAIDAFLKLTDSPDPSICAGAYLRIARNYRKAGNAKMALEAYEKLAQFSHVRFEGVPAELAARQARCALLAELGNSEDLGSEARSLYSDLIDGRWQLTRSAFQLHSEQVRKWWDSAVPREEILLALSATVDWLWELWRNSLAGGAPLPESMTHSERAYTFTILLGFAGDPNVVLVAGPRFIQSQWISPVKTSLEAQDLEIYLQDSRGNAVLAEPPVELEHKSFRLQADTGLPWTVVVGSQSDIENTAQFASRRRLLLTGLGLVIILFIACSYLIGRAFSKEMSIARLKSDFISAVSHEFRTPLATLHQLTENLAEGRVSGEKRLHEYYQTQARATGRLTRLVDRLLDFGRMEAGAFLYRPEPVELDELVRSVVDEFEHVASTTGHRLELSIAPGLKPVRGDREALAQAIWNLLDNAIKYSPGRPEVWIEVAREDSYAAIRVRDEGPGISQKERKFLFEKFVRGAAARSSTVKGSGIGLAMVDRIVRAHKGRILLESTPGRGSTFTILLRMEET